LADGDDVISKLEDFKQHFLTQATPIMIGGGVLAYTMIGISIDQEDEENSKFLILDPHYTGNDVLKNVIKKKGVSWKGKEMFLPGTFYNFCLPNACLNEK